MAKRNIIFGLAITVLLILYFLLMKSQHKAHLVDYRLFNGFIMAAGLSALFYYNRKKEEDSSLLGFMAAGVKTSFICAFTFAIFMAVYTIYLDKAFAAGIMTDRQLPNIFAANPEAVIFSVIFLEGILSGVMLSFILGQVFAPAKQEISEI